VFGEMIFDCSDLEDKMRVDYLQMDIDRYNERIKCHKGRIQYSTERIKYYKQKKKELRKK